MATDSRTKEEQTTQRRAELLQVRYFDTRTLSEIPMFDGILTVPEMYDWHTVILSMEDNRVIFAITTATPQQALGKLRDRFSDYRVNFVMISEAGFKEFMLQYDPPEKIEYKDISIKPEMAAQSLADVTETIETVRPDDVFNYLVRQAAVLNASDIHLETRKDSVQVRFRVDGVLHRIADISVEKYRQLTSTLAIQANIATSAPVAQTGHMNHQITTDEGQLLKEVNMRIETIPTLHGQDSVIRLFTIDRSLLNLKNLGLSQEQREMVDEVVNHPTGLVLAVGPTGSGKTTSLYSMINQLNSPERKIITLEDPVEYSLDGVTQIPVDTNGEDSFAEKLRAVLRLDPDVIMVGEIRDVDTAKTALQASLSGHLVLSTFHAADTTSALSRLKEFVGDNPLFTSAIRLLIAQRLVRKLDESSRERVELDEHTLARMAADFEHLPEKVPKPSLDDAMFYKAVKTENSPFGYDGQVAIVEILKMSSKLEHLLNSKDAVTGTDLREIAIEEGMIGMLQDGLIKATQGITTVDEVYRVVA